MVHGAGGPESVASGSGWARTLGSNGGGSSMAPMIGSTAGDADSKPGRGPGARASTRGRVVIPVVVAEG